MEPYGVHGRGVIVMTSHTEIVWLIYLDMFRLISDDDVSAIKRE